MATTTKPKKPKRTVKLIYAVSVPVAKVDGFVKEFESVTSMMPALVETDKGKQLKWDDYVRLRDAN